MYRYQGILLSFPALRICVKRIAVWVGTVHMSSKPVNIIGEENLP